MCMLENNVLLSICSFVTVLLYSFLVDQILDIYVFFFSPNYDNNIWHFIGT